MTIDTDWIAGYADGETPPDRRQAVDAALARDPALAAALRREREAAALLEAAFSPVEEPLPPALATLLAPALQPLPVRRPRSSARVWLGGLAAALMLAALGGLGWSALRTIDGLENRLSRIEAAEQQRLAIAAATDNGRADALERTPNGREATWTSGDGATEGRVRPVTTFIDSAGRFCREFSESIRDPDGQRAGGGIACRVGKGDWRMWWADAGDSTAGATDL